MTTRITKGLRLVNNNFLCVQVQQRNQDDDSLAWAIAEKLGDTPGVSYSEIANKALECGRTELAIKV